MNILFCVFIFFLLICPINADAELQDVSNFDGNNWTEWQASQKYSFISGFIAGTASVVRTNLQAQDEKHDSEKASQIYYSYLIPDEKKPKNTFSRKEVSLLLENRKEDFNADLYRHMIIGITNGQIVEGLNLFYGDFKNKQIKLEDAIYVVKKQIKGGTAEEIEAILQYLRTDKDFKKLFYTDKDGKKKYVRFP